MKATVKGREVTLWNVFTKSYPNRRIVHAGVHRKDEEHPKTICGREVFQTSQVQFENVDGACEKCLLQIEIGKRTHAGWE